MRVGAVRAGMSVEVTCYDCGDSYALADRKRCECGEPLWIAGDVTAFDPDDGAYGVGRYGDLLPVDPVGVGTGTGGTPLVRTEGLDDVVGCRLHVKDEGENPTGSFKDRGSAVGVAYAHERGANRVGTVSHGNMAMSMSAHAASVGMGCVVLVPARIPPGRLGLIAQYDPDLVQAEGDYGRLYYEALEAGPALGVEFVNSDTPLRVAGQKTVAFEIFEAFGGVPDGVVLPVSSGGHASAVWKGFRELERAGVADRVPPLYFVQAAACDPIAQAYRNGDDEVTPVEPGETIAFSIANGSPPSGNRALAAARRTGGAVLSVPDDEIREATDRMARQAGLCVEPACATPVAGLRHLSADGAVDDEAEVVAIATGTGFKELGGEADVDAATVAVSDLERELGSAL
jgi:threonine synthase